MSSPLFDPNEVAPAFSNGPAPVGSSVPPDGTRKGSLVWEGGVNGGWRQNETGMLEPEGLMSGLGNPQAASAAATVPTGSALVSQGFPAYGGGALTSMNSYPQMSSNVDLAPSATTTEATMPEWYTNYAQQILANQQAIANQPYATYQGPRLADFTPAQQQAFGMTRDAAGAGQGALTSALQGTQSSFGRSGLNAAQPYMSAVAGMSGAQAASPYLEQGVGMFNQVGQSNALGAAQPLFNQAASLSGVNAATPNLQQGANLYGQSTQALGMQSAQPYLTAAGNTSVGNINTYMNPYQDQVVNRIGELGARTLRENILPEISDRFIGAGSFGGSRQAEATGRAIRDAMEGISAQQSAALQSGYGQAAGLSQADLARQAQLASTAGQLGSQQQGALQSAASGMANIGTSLGNLTAEQQRALTNLGTSTGQIYGQDINAKQAAGTGLANIGQTYGNLTADQQRILSNLASTTGNLYNADTAQQNETARQMAALGQQQQTMGLTGAGALQGIGQQQQQFGQQNLDLAYQDFLRQQGYAQQQNTGMMGALQGTAGAIPKASLQTGYGPVANTQAAQPSGAQNLASTAAAIANIASIFKGP